MIYAVVRYPKSIEYAEGYDFNIYAKQSSNQKRMQEYYKEIKRRFPNHYVHLVSREKAKTMKTKWYAVLLERDRRRLERYWNQ